MVKAKTIENVFQIMHSLEDGTACIEDKLLQSHNLNNFISKGKFPGERPDSTKVGSLWLSATMSQEEIGTVSDGSNSRNHKLDAKLKMLVCQDTAESECR